MEIKSYTHEFPNSDIDFNALTKKEKDGGFEMELTEITWFTHEHISYNSGFQLKYKNGIVQHFGLIKDENEA